MLILQETHSTPECESMWENEWGGKAIFSHGTSAARGVAIFMSKSIYKNISDIYRDISGRMIMVNITDNEVKITLIALYAPNQDTPTFF